MPCLYQRENTLPRPSLPLLVIVTESGLVPNNGLHIGVDVSDKATVIHVRACDVEANTNDIIGREYTGAGIPSHGDIVAARGVGAERTNTVGCVAAADRVVLERPAAGGCVEPSGDVA